MLLLDCSPEGHLTDVITLKLKHKLQRICLQSTDNKETKSAKSNTKQLQRDAAAYT